jgi:hypothetical protein
MSTTAAEISTRRYRIGRSAPNGGFQSGDVTDVIANEEGHASFLADPVIRPEPFSGDIDPALVQVINLTPAMDFSDPPNADWTAEDVKRELKLESDEALTIAMQLFGAPQGRMRFVTDPRNIIGPVTAAYRIWKQRDVEQYKEKLRRVWPHALQR